MVKQLQLKAATRDALGSLEEVDIANDPQWKQGLRQVIMLDQFSRLV